MGKTTKQIQRGRPPLDTFYQISAAEVKLASRGRGS